MPLTLGAIAMLSRLLPSSSRRNPRYTTLYTSLLVARQSAPLRSPTAQPDGTISRPHQVYTRKKEVDSDRFHTRINLNPHTHPGAPVSVRLPRPTLPCI
ncbi:uncharacterized protein B0T23DRAFT_119209 [Neurospora hispaniola]|uniref:Uncharacterized protein n=1 Tax=Neurospora hispaniola TaxID=588809 RepID=A0AAJ0IAC0_9PEZI|nr:hypothetical protein B0T23DRAFT_119209 [Neurospora hispaniola]